MTLQELKEAIINNELTNDFLVLVCEDNYFIANQYIDTICTKKCLSKHEIKSILEPQQSALSLVMNFGNNLNILKVDTFDEDFEDYSLCTDVVVVCKSIDKRLETKLTDYIVKLPKLVDWQVQDYIKACCAGLGQEECEFLAQAANNDIYKVDNEVNKISMFAPPDQKLVLSELRYTKDTDLVSIPVFDLVDALIKKDIRKLGYCLYYRDNCDFEPTGIITQLLNKYKGMLFLIGGGLTLDQLGMSKGQAYYLRKDANGYTIEELRRKIKFVTEFDQKLKFGQMDMSKPNQVDYIIANILAL